MSSKSSPVFPYCYSSIRLFALRRLRLVSSSPSVSPLASRPSRKPPGDPVVSVSLPAVFPFDEPVNVLHYKEISLLEDGAQRPLPPAGENVWQVDG